MVEELKDMTKEELIDFGVESYGLNREGLENSDTDEVLKVVKEAHEFMSQ